MKALFVAVLLGLCVPARAQLLGRTTVATVGGGNALSTPAARHLVRTATGAYLLALQRDDAGTRHGLVLYRSDDDARTWSFVDTLDPDPANRQTADMVAAGDDVALVRSFDAPSIVPDAVRDPRRQVWFQWQRWDGKGRWIADPPVLVFDPPAGSAYHRAELAIDSLGRIWVQAFRRGAQSCEPLTDPKCAMCFETENGDNYANELVVAVSSDGGRTFSPPQALAQTLCRAGGRLLWANGRLFILWNDYSANEAGTRITTKIIAREDTAPEAVWGPALESFPDRPDDGVYHGAALSAVADGPGFHLAYKDQNQLRLWYRFFDGVGFGPRVLVDDSEGDWALQPATAIGRGGLFILANHLTVAGYETRMWRLRQGLGAARALTLESEAGFNGYPAAPERVPPEADAIPFLHSRTPSSALEGVEVALRVSVEPPQVELEFDGEAPGDGTAGRIPVHLEAENAYAGAVSLSVSGTPQGASAGFEEATVSLAHGAADTALRLDPGTAADGQYDLEVVARFYTAAVPANLRWTIARPPPAVALSSSDVVIAAGHTVDLSMAAAPLPWFRGAIAIRISGLPESVLAEPAGTAIAPGAQGAVTLSAAAGALDATAQCQLTLTAAPQTATVPLLVRVASAPQAIVVAPETASVVSGVLDVRIAARVSPNTSLAKQEVLLDGAVVAEGGHFAWDTTAASEGAHVLAARVTDAAGGSATSAGVVVNVYNPRESTLPGPAVPAAHRGCASAGAAPIAVLGLAFALLLRRRRRENRAV